MKVGDKFYFVPVPRRGDPYELTITKVGRTYAYASKYSENDIKIYIKGMFVDAGNYSPSTYLYESKEKYELEQKTSEKWRELKAKISYSAPKNITLQNIEEAIKLLGLE